MDKANKLGDHVYDAGYTMRQYDVHVTLEGAPTVRFDPESQAEQLHRLEQLANDPTLPLEALAGTRL